MGLDVVEIAPEAKPPVVKIIEYKKFKYLEDKKEKEARKKAKQTELKEVRFSPFIGEHDLQTNLRKVKEFLKDGDMVKISVVFKGRQMTHQEYGPKVLERIMLELGDTATIERPPRMEGRRFVTTLRPAKGAIKEETNGKPEAIADKKKEQGKQEAVKEKEKEEQVTQESKT